MVGMSTDNVTAIVSNNEQISVEILVVGFVTAVILFLIGCLLVKCVKNKAISRAGKSIEWLAYAVFMVFVFAGIPTMKEVIVAFASLAAVIIALLSFDQSRRIRQESLDKENRERKERLLNEIIEWAREINNSSLDIDISPDKTKITIDVEVSLKYAIPFSNNDYISKIIENSFPELKVKFLKLRDTFVGFLYLRSLDIGMKNPEDNFKGQKYLEIIENIKKQTNSKENKVKELLHNHSIDLANDTNELLKEAAVSKTKLM
ncbi:MAG: hypothetical protein ACYDG5_06655, partial [Dehalococcoidales bacterium]